MFSAAIKKGACVIYGTFARCYMGTCETMRPGGNCRRKKGESMAGIFPIVSLKKRGGESAPGLPKKT